jgi:hypothetical protein
MPRLRDQPLEPPLPLHEGKPAKVAAVQPEEIEPGVMEVALAANQEQEIGTTIRIDSQDLAVQDGVPHPEPVPELAGKLVEPLEREAAPAISRLTSDSNRATRLSSF